ALLLHVVRSYELRYRDGRPAIALVQVVALEPRGQGRGLPDEFAVQNSLRDGVAVVLSGPSAPVDLDLDGPRRPVDTEECIQVSGAAGPRVPPAGRELAAPVDEPVRAPREK